MQKLRLQQDQHIAEVALTFTTEQRAAMRAELAEVLRPETDRSIKWSIIIGALGFVTGVLGTLAVALYVHPFH